MMVVELSLIISCCAGVVDIQSRRRGECLTGGREKGVDIGGGSADNYQVWLHLQAMDVI
jgi:hypothetical protein